MGTSKIPLEKVEALLKIDAGNGSLSDHLVRIVRKLTEEQPADALAQLEAVSRHLKQGAFRGAPAPDEALPFILDAPAQEQLLKWCADVVKLVRQPSDPASNPQVVCMVQNFLEDAAMFHWAGVGFGKQESYHIAMCLRKLAAEMPSLQNLRLWGKVLGTDGDYYVAEGTMKPLPRDESAKPADPGTPEYDVEPRGTGANKCLYWVSAGGAAPWIQLPAARASHIVAARSIKRLMTGDLASPVDSAPLFPGKERHFLRAQIARISSTCTLAVKDMYSADEDKIALTPGFEFPDAETIVAPDAWCHIGPFLYLNGKSTRPNVSDLENRQEDPLPKELLEQLKREEDETEHTPLEGLEGDLESTPCFSVKTCGDKGMYDFDGTKKSYIVTALRSLIWPGAVTVSQGSKCANIYVGYALKCGTLIEGPARTAEPYRGTCAFSPLIPDEIMEEPADLEEQPEPNPQDDVESDHGDVDEDDEENA